jgi:hypothetical protein
MEMEDPSSFDRTGLWRTQKTVAGRGVCARGGHSKCDIYLCTVNNVFFWGV